MKKLKYLMTIALICVLAVVIYYFAISRKDKDDSPDTENSVSEVSKVLAKDLDGNYPVSAREVVSYFISIQKCYYNEKLKENDLVQLAYQAMKLFDSELVAANEFDDYYEKLAKEVEEYHSDGKTINKTILDRASEVIYSEIKGVRYAKLNCIYYLQTSGSTVKVTETYVLRCDDKGRWKILGWQLYEPSEYEQ